MEYINLRSIFKRSVLERKNVFIIKIKNKRKKADQKQKQCYGRRDVFKIKVL